MSGNVEISGNVIEAGEGETIEALMRRSGIIPDAYLFLVNGKPVPMDTPIADGMNVRAIKVASGG
ncbi:MAG: MoaD/ThiS family protein [Candidatus Methanomethylophilus sp.]|nr:MoaD/ThiS family protein [Methanomethylophilus sp.]